MRRPYPLRHTLLLLAPIILACSPAAAAASLANAACHLILRADLPATVVPRFGAVVTVSINSFPAELGISTSTLQNPITCRRSRSPAKKR
jgi:hypothetical protein